MRSLAEVRFRINQEVSNLLLFALPPSPGSIDVSFPLAGLPDPAGISKALAGTAFAAATISLAERILSGYVPLLGTSIETGPEPAWRRDYLSGKETAAVFFRRIPYLDARTVGDHKNIWELNRHQHLVLVAQAFTLTGDRRYSGFVTSQLRHWWRENPFQRGINWASSLEVAFRALSWLWLLHLLGTAMDAEFRNRFLTELYRHGLHLEANLSIYFSPNTHLLGEALALHALGHLIPQFRHSGRWRQTGRAVMVDALQNQVHSDGGYFEQSTWYHLYALDMFLFHHILEPFPVTGKLIAMAEFLATVVGTDGKVPFLGDDDGGRLFFPFGPRCGFARATLATCSVVLQRDLYRFDEGDLNEQAAWWLGPKAMKTPGSGLPALSKCFRASGLVAMQSEDVRILFDVGPFGPWGGGHSHSDTLSLTVSAGAREILVDAGTYTYVGDSSLRDWFRSSAAHNTVRIDGRDQADPSGPFRWRNKPVVELLSWESNSEYDEAEAACAYAGMRHRRVVTFQKQDRLLKIVDKIEGGTTRHLIEQFWHPGGAPVFRGTGCWDLGNQDELILDPGADCEVMESWRSDAPASKRPVPVIRVRVSADTPVELRATLRFGGIWSSTS